VLPFYTTYFILIAVHRGKIAEGMDFTDEMARLVILIGIPYPPFKDEKIVLIFYF